MTLPSPPRRPRPTREQFVEALLANNPFAVNRISDPAQMDSDVESIHAKQFGQICERAVEACRERRGRGLLLLGAAGTGKSHLLARVARWAATDHRACFVFLHNIQVAPDDVDRYLLKGCITRLAEDRLDRLHETQLFHVVSAAIKKAAEAEKIATLSDSNREEVFEKLKKRLGGDAHVFGVILKFFTSVTLAHQSKDGEKRKKHARLAALAVRWLKGDLLDADEAKRLGQLVPHGSEVARLDEDQVQTVLLTISRLARESHRPFALCVDQADNMKHAQLTALGKALHVLIDKAENLLVVVSGVKEELLQRIREGVITEAAADRLESKVTVEIGRIARADARELLHARLHGFWEQFESVPPEFKPFDKDDALFPLGSSWFDNREPGSIELRPRDVLTWANDRWRSIQQRIRDEGFDKWLKTWKQASSDAVRQPTPAEILAAIDAKVAAKIEEGVNGRRLQKGNLPADAGNLLGLTAGLLEQCLDQPATYTVKRVEKPANQHVHLIVHEEIQGRPITNYVQFVVTGSKTSAAAHLKRLLNSEGPTHRILVTDEERAPLTLGEAGKQYLDALQALGPQSFQHIKLDFAQYATLDALLSVVGEARSGDLEIEPVPERVVPVSEDQVIESLHRQNRYLEHPLLRVFLDESGGPPPPPLQLPEAKAFREFVLAKLSFWMGSGLIELLRSFLIVEADPAISWEACLPRAKEIVIAMHEEELVSAKPWDNDMFLVLGSKA